MTVALVAGCGRIAFDPSTVSDANGVDADETELCATTPCCEAVAGGRCYYIDAQNGDDANPATFEQPWRSYLPLVGPVQLVAGDVVYFMNGTYSDTWTTGTLPHALLFDAARNYALTGTPEAPIVLRAYPGHVPVLSMPSTTPMSFEAPSHVHVRGFVVGGGDGTGVFVRRGTNILIEDVRVAGITSVINAAYQGFNLNMSTGVTLRRVDAVDIYNPSSTGYGISSAFSSFELIDSRITLSQPTNGMCINGLTASGSRVINNVFTNCGGGVRLEGERITVAGNQLRRSTLDLIFRAIDVAVTYNTLIDSRLRFMFLNTTALANRFESNIVIDSLSATFDASTSQIAVMPSGDMTWRASFDGGTALTSNNNCIHASASPSRLSYFGIVDTVAQWQARGFDATSSFIDPVLDATGAPTAAGCTGYGHTNAP
jgi:hypothetical protein